MHVFKFLATKALVILFNLIAAKWLITGWFSETIRSLGALFRSVSNLASARFEIQG